MVVVTLLFLVGASGRGMASALLESLGAISCHLQAVATESPLQDSSTNNALGLTVGRLYASLDSLQSLLSDCWEQACDFACEHPSEVFLQNLRSQMSSLYERVLQTETVFQTYRQQLLGPADDTVPTTPERTGAAEASDDSVDGASFISICADLNRNLEAFVRKLHGGAIPLGRPLETPQKLLQIHYVLGVWELRFLWLTDSDETAPGCFSLLGRELRYAIKNVGLLQKGTTQRSRIQSGQNLREFLKTALTPTRGTAEGEQQQPLKGVLAQVVMKDHIPTTTTSGQLVAEKDALLYKTLEEYQNVDNLFVRSRH